MGGIIINNHKPKSITEIEILKILSFSNGNSPSSDKNRITDLVYSVLYGYHDGSSKSHISESGKYLGTKDGFFRITGRISQDRDYNRAWIMGWNYRSMIEPSKIHLHHL